MKLCLPEKFNVNYPEKNKKYYSGDNTKILRQILMEASNGYCMYCGKSLLQDRKEDFQLEHSVDKDGNYNQFDKKSMLINCKYNFAASCSKCNLVYKKRIEKIDFSQYQLVEKCPDKCTKMCNTYISMRTDYCKINSIILQPFGYSNKDLSYKVRYNLLRHIYEPDMNQYDESDIFFVEHHIMRFALNGYNYSTNVIDICSEIFELYEFGVINLDSLFKIETERWQPNIIGFLFVKFIKEQFSCKNVRELIDYCELIVLLSATI